MSERILSVGGNKASRPINEFYMYQRPGTNWYIDSNQSVGGNGKSFSRAFKTFTQLKASAIKAGDRVGVYGSFNEALAWILAGVEFIGMGTTSNRALWTAPDTTAPCLTITAAPDVTVENIRMRPPVGNAAISLIGVSHQFAFLNGRIQGKAGSTYGILTDGGQSNVRIEDSEFIYINTAAGAYAIFGQTYTSEPTGWILRRNKFHSNLNHIVCRMRQSVIEKNVFAGKGLLANGSMGAPDKSIDISGATGGCNIVTKNMLGGAYTTALYVSGTDDCWFGNWCNLTATTAPSGFSILAPAA